MPINWKCIVWTSFQTYQGFRTLVAEVICRYFEIIFNLLHEPNILSQLIASIIITDASIESITVEYGDMKIAKFLDTLFKSNYAHNNHFTCYGWLNLFKVRHAIICRLPSPNKVINKDKQ